MNPYQSTVDLDKKIGVYVATNEAPEDHVWWFPKPYCIVETTDEADIVVFTGGPDVNPEIYQHQKHPTTSVSLSRDTADRNIYAEAKELSLPMLGICRGAQFLCVMAGGTLIQNQSNLLGSHVLQTFTKKSILTTSDHHQAQYPWNLPKDTWDLLGWTENLSEAHIGWKFGHGFKEVVICQGKHASNPFQGKDLPEIEDAYYRNINALAIQSHPEWLSDNDTQHVTTLGYYRSLVLRLINGWDKMA